WSRRGARRTFSMFEDCGQNRLDPQLVTDAELGARCLEQELDAEGNGIGRGMRGAVGLREAAGKEVSVVVEQLAAGLEPLGSGEVPGDAGVGLEIIDRQWRAGANRHLLLILQHTGGRVGRQ